MLTESLAWPAEMPYAVPNYSIAEVDRAVELLCGLIETDGFDWLGDALAALDNWKASHQYPLTAFRITLGNRAARVDRESIVAQRIKRRSSIIKKLETRIDLRLSEIQDIG